MTTDSPLTRAAVKRGKGYLPPATPADLQDPVGGGPSTSTPSDAPLAHICALLGAFALFLLAECAERSRGHVQP